MCHDRLNPFHWIVKRTFCLQVGLGLQGKHLVCLLQRGQILLEGKRRDFGIINCHCIKVLRTSKTAQSEILRLSIIKLTISTCKSRETIASIPRIISTDRERNIVKRMSCECLESLARYIRNLIGGSILHPPFFLFYT